LSEDRFYGQNTPDTQIHLFVGWGGDSSFPDLSPLAPLVSWFWRFWCLTRLLRDSIIFSQFKHWWELPVLFDSGKQWFCWGSYATYTAGKLQRRQWGKQKS